MPSLSSTLESHRASAPYRSVMKPLLASLTLAISAAALADSPMPRPQLELGRWRAWLDCPGGELPFALEIVAPATDDKPFGITAFIRNGEERMEIPVVKWEGQELVLSIDYYDAHLRAKVSENGKRLDGGFTKTRSTGVARMPFHAAFGAGDRFTPEGPRTRDLRAIGARRWNVRFAEDPDGAALVLDGFEHAATGTLLTTTGDWRFLAGDFWKGRLRLSAFDGAHAFLLTANIQPDGSLKGDFWSGDWHHDTWTAVRDDNAALPDAFAQASIVSAGSVNNLSFPDLEGKPRSLGEEALGGKSKARILYLFGSWCPNCKDATTLLNEMRDEFGPKGLSVLGLAFEVTGERDRDAKQASLYADRSGVTFPVLLAGKAKKEETAAALAPVISGFKAYPTAIFVDRAGKPRAVYTGFSGPATGEEHAKLKAQWRKIVEELLNG